MAKNSNKLDNVDKLYDANELDALITKGAINLLKVPGVTALKAQNTADETVTSLKKAADELPEGGVLLQPVVLPNPDKDYGHAALIVFQKGKGGKPDSVTYVDSLGDPLPIEHAKALQENFPGVSIKNSDIIQQSDDVSCGAHVVRNATAVVEALSNGKAIDVNVFTKPTAEELAEQRAKDTVIRVGLQPETPAAMKKTATLIDGWRKELHEIVTKDMNTPSMIGQILQGSIPGSPPDPTYTPKSFMAYLGLQLIELGLFGMDPRAGSGIGMGSLDNKKSFAFRDSTLTDRWKTKDWRDEIGPIGKVLVTEVEKSLEKLNPKPFNGPSDEQMHNFRDVMTAMSADPKQKVLFCDSVNAVLDTEFTPAELKKNPKALSQAIEAKYADVKTDKVEALLADMYKISKDASPIAAYKSSKSLREQAKELGKTALGGGEAANLAERNHAAAARATSGFSRE